MANAQAGKFFLVDLDLDLDARCCARSRRDKIVCVHQAAAARAKGIDVGTLVHPSDTVIAWKKQYAFCPVFSVPTGTVQRGPTASIKLKVDDEHEVQIIEPPMSAYPRGRPKKKRIESLVKPKKLRKCGKCKQMVDDHDARTCKGIGEVPASLHQHHRMAFDQARTSRFG